MIRLFTITVVVFSLLQHAHAEDRSKIREWVDSTGRFRVKATLVEVKSGNVVLKLVTGKTVTVPVGQLSDADRAFIRDSENPFAPGNSGGTGAPAGSGKALSFQQRWAQPKTINWDTVKKIGTRERVAWNVPVVSNRLQFDIDRISLAKRSNERVSSYIAVDTQSRRGVVGCKSTNSRSPSTRVALVDLVSGRVAYSKPVSGDFTIWGLLGSGSDIIVTSKKDRFRIWSLRGDALEETGEWVYDFTLTETPLSRMNYVDDDYAIINDGILVHLPSKIKVCQYEGLGNSIVGGVTLFVTNVGNEYLLRSFDVPHPAALAAQHKAEADPGLFLIHPGVAVSVDVSGVPSQFQGPVRDRLTSAVEASGYKVSAGAEITVAATVTGPKMEAVSYIASGSYVVQEYRSMVQLKWHGKDLYSRGSSNIPQLLQTRQGQTVKQKLDELGKQPNLDIFKSVRFPKLMQKPSDVAGGTLMKATFTADGIVDR